MLQLLGGNDINTQEECWTDDETKMLDLKYRSYETFLDIGMGLISSPH